MAGIRFSLRYGSSVPTTSNLNKYELGWCTSNKALYINDNGTIKLAALPLSGGTLTGTLNISSGNFNLNTGNAYIGDTTSSTQFYVTVRSVSGSIGLYSGSTGNNMLLYTKAANASSGKSIIMVANDANNTATLTVNTINQTHTTTPSFTQRNIGITRGTTYTSDTTIAEWAMKDSSGVTFINISGYLGANTGTTANTLRMRMYTNTSTASYRDAMFYIDSSNNLRLCLERMASSKEWQDVVCSAGKVRRTIFVATSASSVPTGATDNDIVLVKA